MSRSRRHEKKSAEQLRAYNRAIGKQRYEATVDETLMFNDSSTPGEELSEPTSSRRRPINRQQRIYDHFKNNWIGWIVAAFVAVSLYFMIDAKVDLTRVESAANFNRGSIQELDSELYRNNEHDANQDLSIQENRLRVEQLEKNAGPERGGRNP